MIGEVLKREVGIVVRRAKTHLGLPAYTKPQQYNVTFTTEVQNKSDKNNKVEVIMPVSISEVGSYQSVAGLKIYPEDAQIKMEPKYGNRYVYWSHWLRPSGEGSRANFSLQFRASILPRSGPERYTQLGDLLDENTGNLYIDPNHPVVKALVGDPNQYFDKWFTAKKFNRHVIDNLRYGDPINGLYSTKDALTRDRVDCGGYATLLASLCIAANIPARILSGYWAGYPQNEMHAWLEVLPNPSDGWLPLDPSIEQLFSLGRTAKYARPGFVGSDRIVLSRGSYFMLDFHGIAIPASILQTPIIEPNRGVDSVITTTRFITS